MRDSEPAREPVPMPRNIRELKQWIQRANNTLTYINAIKAARAEAIEAVKKSYEPILAPQQGILDMWLDGIRRYARENESRIKRTIGRKLEYEVFALEYQVNPEAVTAVDDRELVEHLEKNGFPELVRVEKAPDRTKIKGAYHTLRPLRQRAKLRKVLREAGADVSKHQVITLSMPSTLNPKKPTERKPLVLEERRYPALPPSSDEVD